MPDKHNGFAKTVAVAVVISFVLSVSAQALYMWRNDSVQQNQIQRNSDDITKLDSEKADRSEYESIQKRLDAIDNRLERMEKRMDNLADRKR